MPPNPEGEKREVLKPPTPKGEIYAHNLPKSQVIIKFAISPLNTKFNGITKSLIKKSFSPIPLTFLQRLQNII